MLLTPSACFPTEFSKNKLMWKPADGFDKGHLPIFHLKTFCCHLTILRVSMTFNVYDISLRLVPLADTETLSVGGVGGSSY